MQAARFGRPRCYDSHNTHNWNGLNTQIVVNPARRNYGVHRFRFRLRGNICQNGCPAVSSLGIPNMPLPSTDRAALRQALLSPRSVAIVGQSDDAAKTTGRPLKYL